MHLHSLIAKNYRALRTAQVSFDETTVLIGENDCGKSSLLEALAMVLDPQAGEAAPRFQLHHFHSPVPHSEMAAGTIYLELRFRERRPGEWQALAESPLGPVLGSASKTRRELVLAISATRPVAGAESVAEWRLYREGAVTESVNRDPRVLACLRQMNPLIHMRGGDMVGASAARPVDRRSHTFPADVAQLVERIEHSHAAILAGTTADVQATLNEGFDAAREFMAHAAHHLNGQRHNFREMVAEILDSRHQTVATEATTLPQFAGAAAERIGVLVLMAAILRALPGELAAAAEPIWVIEDPEAQLHPMTLASVLALIGHINWQKIITTQSGEVLAAEPLASLRRLTRVAGVMREWRVRPRSLSAEDLRRVGYHLRARRGIASFARCWLLVEGETEFWILPELARIAGYDFNVEGIACVEFAQCGLKPLIKFARELGIEWHVLTDGDKAGDQYVEQARRFVGKDPEAWRITALRERDIENCFYKHGYAEVFQGLAAGAQNTPLPARQAIARAIDRHSKPMLALELILAAATRGAAGVPPSLAGLIEACVALARATPQRRHLTAHHTHHSDGIPETQA